MKEKDSKYKMKKRKAEVKEKGAEFKRQKQSGPKLK